ncbi:MAG: deoxyribodipyrimidine photo-lyase, partial [Acidobacteriia bacterium]|nr:deoxyribodipyrimidine photo-lyase [Terriglobia bacterium]
MNLVQKTSEDARVLVRRSGAPCAEGSCVVYWMQRAQRACDNPALDVAVNLGNALRKPVVVFFAPVPFYPGANARHFHFLAAGIADIADGLTQRGIGFVFRAYPDHSLLKFCDQVHPAIVIGDENPLREAEDWRQKVARNLSVTDFRVGIDVADRLLPLGLEEDAVAVRVFDHARPRAVAAVGRAGVRHQEQHPVRVAVHDARHRAVAVFAEGVLRL